MSGQDTEIAKLTSKAEAASHWGFCMSPYVAIDCVDCLSETDCLKLFLKELENERSNR
jgi:hypothetical protein